MSCATLTHLRHTLDVDWSAFDGGRPLQPGWEGRATRWRTRPGTKAWRGALRGPLSYAGLVHAQRAAGLPTTFRRSDAFCRDRTYTWRPDLDRRFASKLDRDATDDVSPVARAVRGYLDIIHVHPFGDGNARAACTWLVRALVTADLDIPDLEAFVRLPKPPGHLAVPGLLVGLLQ